MIEQNNATKPTGDVDQILQAQLMPALTDVALMRKQVKSLNRIAGVFLGLFGITFSIFVGTYGKAIIDSYRGLPLMNKAAIEKYDALYEDRNNIREDLTTCAAANQTFATRLPEVEATATDTANRLLDSERAYYACQSDSVIQALLDQAQSALATANASSRGVLMPDGSKVYLPLVTRGK